jgi:glycosyltransferase involved in cell wall biosynthesis
MNVLIVSPDFDFGGVASVVRNLTQYLRSVGHNVQMLYPGHPVFAQPKTSRFGLPGVEVRFQAPFGKRHPAVSLIIFAALFPIGLLQLMWRIFRRRIQVVNIHYPTDSLFYFGLCRRLLRFTLVCSIHGADFSPAGKPPANSRGMRILLRYADRIVTPSDDYRRKVIEVFPEYADKTVFIHNGIDLSEFSIASQDIDSPPKGRYVLSVSAYKEQKALDVLIRAMESVAARNPEIKLILVGEGPLREELEALSEKLGLVDRIEFHGPKSRREVIRLLRSCEVFVLPSRFETFGIAIVEAMACGRPVVAANAGGMPEIVRNGVTGILVNTEDPSSLADALNALLGNPSLRQHLGENALNAAHARFPATSMGAAYERVFELKGLIGHKPNAYLLQ